MNHFILLHKYITIILEYIINLEYTLMLLINMDTVYQVYSALYIIVIFK